MRGYTRDILLGSVKVGEITMHMGGAWDGEPLPEGKGPPLYLTESLYTPTAEQIAEIHSRQHIKVEPQFRPIERGK